MLHFVEFHFLKSNCIEYENTVLTSVAVTTFNNYKNLSIIFWCGLYISEDIYLIFRWGGCLALLLLLLLFYTNAILNIKFESAKLFMYTVDQHGQSLKILSKLILSINHRVVLIHLLVSVSQWTGLEWLATAFTFRRGGPRISSHDIKK